MKEVKLDNLDLGELTALRSRVDAAIRDYSERKRRAARSAAEEAIRAHGYGSLKELLGGRASGGKSRGKAAAADSAYRNPIDPSQTWSGRGRRPGWINEALQSGRSLEDLAG